MIAVQSGLRAAVAYLNQPVVKETVKNIVGLVTFTIGLIAARSLYANGKPTFKPRCGPNIDRAVDVTAKISLVLSGAVSPPGVWIISSIAGRIFRPEQLTRAFGPNTIFAANPWHPRHVVSIAAAVLNGVTLPFTFGSRLGHLQSFNLVTGRPTLHFFNYLFQKALRA